MFSTVGRTDIVGKANLNVADHISIRAVVLLWANLAICPSSK